MLPITSYAVILYAAGLHAEEARIFVLMIGLIIILAVAIAVVVFAFTTPNAPSQTL